MLHAVIMAGGAGTRFWPASRAALPKQLLDLADGRTMIQATLDRLDGLVPIDRVVVMTNKNLVAPLSRQLPGLPVTAVLGEPCKRDTAPCVGLAAALLVRQDPEAILAVISADHVIRQQQAFQGAISHAAGLVEDDPSRIVTFGIRPSYPAESFGYIQRGEALPVGDSAPPTFRVLRFREKPSAEVAQQYLQSGDYYWNSGIFVWKAATILDALRRFEPEMSEHLDTIAAAAGGGEFSEVFEREFVAIGGKSIDYAVMERYDNVAVVEAPFDWDDIGSWQALTRLHGTDSQGHTAVGGRHLGVRSTGCIVRSQPDHLVVTLGVHDCIVVHTPDATLVANKHDEESIRQVVQLLKEQGWDEYL